MGRVGHQERGKGVDGVKLGIKDKLLLLLSFAWVLSENMT